MTGRDWFPNTGYYIQELFDPVQTHAVYGVRDTEVEDVKKILKDKGCSKFRIVRAGSPGLRIVCFKKPTTCGKCHLYPDVDCSKQRCPYINGR